MKKEGIEKLIERFLGLYHTIRESSHNGLNSCINGGLLLLTDDTPLKKMKKKIEELLDITIEICLQDEELHIFDILKNQEDYENNKEFISWLEDYMMNRIGSLKETALINDLKPERYNHILQYCFRNFILQDIGESQLDEAVISMDEFKVLRKLIFTFLDMVICRNYSKNRAISHLQDIANLQENYCEVLWDLIHHHEERLWRFMLMRKYNKIEDMLELLVERN